MIRPFFAALFARHPYNPNRAALSRRLGIWWSIYVEHRLQSYGGVFSKRWHHRLVQWFGWQLHDWRRRIQGARAVKQGDTVGCVYDEGLEIEFSGMCPVQGEGELDGRVCYYRSRGDGWQFSVAPTGSDDVFADDAWEYWEERYIWPAGGYVAASVSEVCIRKAVALFRAGQVSK